MTKTPEVTIEEARNSGAIILIPDRGWLAVKEGFPDKLFATQSEAMEYIEFISRTVH
jgi:hypothetical protein